MHPNTRTNLLKVCRSPEPNHQPTGISGDRPICGNGKWFSQCNGLSHSFSFNYRFGGRNRTSKLNKSPNLRDRRRSHGCCCCCLNVASVKAPQLAEYNGKRFKSGPVKESALLAGGYRFLKWLILIATITYQERNEIKFLVILQEFLVFLILNWIKVIVFYSGS